MNCDSEELTEQEKVRVDLFQQVDHLIEELNAIRWTIEYPNDAKEDSGGADANYLVQTQIQEVIKPAVSKLEAIAERWEM